MEISNSPLVSIILPVYNVAGTIVFTMQSILKQTWGNFELLIIDDGSTDETLSILRGFPDKRVVLISDGTNNKGISFRLNQGIRLSKGMFIARIDGDDIMFLTRLEEQVDFLLRNVHVDVLGSSALAIDFENNIIGRLNSTVPHSLDELAVRGGCFIHPSVMGRTEWFKDHFYDENYSRCEDFELWLRTFHKDKFHILPQPMIYYRVPGVQPLWKYRAGFTEWKRALKKHREKVSVFAYSKVLLKASIQILFYPVLVSLKLLNPVAPLTQTEQAEFDAKLKAILG